jgi:BP28CT (NUC211) domain
VDIAATDAVVQLCLKLTESELKALLARMAEWRDFERLNASSESDVAPHSDGSWQKHSRGVSFYHLISQLSARLKSIFLPSMVGSILCGSDYLS